MKNERKNMYVSITALVIAVAAITLAYASLSTTLKVRVGKVTQSAFNWDIKLNNQPVEGISSGTSLTSCGNATPTDNSVSVDKITLSKPGDKCSYKISAQNKGDVDANLTSITATSPEGIACDSTTPGKLVCGNIIYSLANDIDGLNLLKVGEQKILKTDGTADFYLVVTYNASQTVPNEEVSHTGGGFTVVYGQD